MNSLYLGGEELKIPVFAMLFLGVWLFVQIPFVSSQELADEEIQSPVETQALNPRTGELDILIGADTAPAVQTENGPSVWAAVRMVFVLALAAAAVYGVVFFIKRSSKQTAEINPFLKILATAHLGSNRYAHIVAVGNKAWLLGSSDGGVNLIGEVDDKDVINAMMLEDSRKAAEGSPNRFPDFFAMLRKLGAPSEFRSSGADDIRKRRERLRGL